uniref:Uncharacterized protein n=1 Tax=Vertebrata isogona TaxID=2006944 RepID=A0A1Z1MFX7_9FLOR|nr:hypothetical protein [Vertebrata isogona]ARW64654.1 hypothetical protein [Vertebrata isogona]
MFKKCYFLYIYNFYILSSYSIAYFLFFMKCNFFVINYLICI